MDKQVIVTCDKISKSYGNKSNPFQLKDLSLCLSAGEITGVVGENGNGKTTLLRILSGDLAHDEGKLTYNALGSITNWYELKEHIAYIPQRIPRWYGHLKDNLLYSSAVHGVKGAQAVENVETLIDELGLRVYAELKWDEISTGYRLRFELARMLLHRPKLLILDEPIANLDINAQQKFLDDLRRMVKDPSREMTVILSSQQLHEIENVSDNIIFLQKGNALFSGDVKDVGKDRTENTFEVSGDFEELALRKALEGLLLTNFQYRANVYVFDTPLAINSNEVLKLLVNEGLSVKYFRDISGSTRKFFG